MEASMASLTKPSLISSPRSSFSFKPVCSLRPPFSVPKPPLRSFSLSSSATPALPNLSLPTNFASLTTSAFSAVGGGGGDELAGGGGGSGGGGDGGSSGGEAEAKSAVLEDVAAEDAILLYVGGMTCGGCAASVKRILESQAQVLSATVYLEKETAVVLPVEEAKGEEDWQKQLGEKLASHLTTCGFNSRLHDLGDK